MKYVNTVIWYFNVLLFHEENSLTAKPNNSFLSAHSNDGQGLGSGILNSILPPGANTSLFSGIQIKHLEQWFSSLAAHWDHSGNFKNIIGYTLDWLDQILCGIGPGHWHFLKGLQSFLKDSVVNHWPRILIW